jgi:hypothetical protein
MKIGTYDGKNVKFEVFWSQCQLVALNNGWDDDVLKTQIAVNLRNEAANQLTRLPDERQFTLAQLKEVLEKQFSSKLREEEACNRLQHFSQRHNQSFFNMAQELRDLVVMAHPNWPSHCVEDETIKLFIESINNPEVRKQLRLVHPAPTTIEELVRHTERLQRVTYVERNVEQNANRRQRNSNNTVENSEREKRCTQFNKRWGRDVGDPSQANRQGKIHELPTRDNDHYNAPSSSNVFNAQSSPKV